MRNNQKIKDEPISAIAQLLANGPNQKFSKETYNNSNSFGRENIKRLDYKR
jgi:hypothetical protein